MAVEVTWQITWPQRGEAGEGFGGGQPVAEAAASRREKAFLSLWPPRALGLHPYSGVGFVGP